MDQKISKREEAMFIPKIDRIEYGGALIGQEERNAINRVIKNQGGRRWTLGVESIAFENELAQVAEVKRAVVVNSGSSALLLALTALHLPKGSRVIIPACTFPTAYNAIIQCNLEPVVVDVDFNTLTLNLNDVLEAISTIDGITAVIAVNIAANPVDLIALRVIVGPDIKIILDNCDGFGTTVSGVMVDSLADISCVSFHAAHIITTGEGGAILTSDETVANTAVKLREWGRASGTDKVYKYPTLPDDYKERYVYEEIGYNLKPLELQCAMGRVQLRKLWVFKQKRQENFKRMTEAFQTNAKFQLIQSLPEASVCWFSFPLICKIPRDRVFKAFEDNNIECRTIFSGNIVRHPAYVDIPYVRVGTLGVSDLILRTGMFLSVHPSITPEMIDFIKEVADDV